MKVLILVNAAHEHRPFYGGVGRDLARRGHSVHFALDSHVTDVMHPDVHLGDHVHYFSDYFRRHFDRRELPHELSDANINLMMFPDTDRLMYTRAWPRRGPDYYLSLGANLAHFFVDLFDRYEFDAVVYENVSNAMSYLAYEVATRRHAKFIGFAQSRMPGRTDVLDCAWARDSRLEGTFELVRTGGMDLSPAIRAFVRDYVDNFDAKLPDYVVHPHPFHASLVERYFHLRPFQRMARSIRYALTQPRDFYFAHQIANPLRTYPEQFVREATRRVKLQVLHERYYETEVDAARPYFAYPLQFHPESSASVDGPAYNDEWSNVNGILQNLPFGYALYVKDHKHAAGRQPLEFYDRLRRLPNVVLVSPNYDAKKLMRQAKAVICSTSTMGYEALVMGKPVYVLGHPFYEFFPSCVHLPSFDGAHDLFCAHDEVRATRADIEALVAAYYLCSEEGRLELLEMFDDPGVMRWIADVIEKKTEEHVARSRGTEVGTGTQRELDS